MYTDQERINRLEFLASENNKRIEALEAKIKQLTKTLDHVNERTTGQIRVGSV